MLVADLSDFKVYLGSAILFVVLSGHHPLDYAVTMYANNAVVGILLYLQSAILGFSVYRESAVSTWYKNFADIYFWGEVFNLIPSAGYACGMAYLLVVTLTLDNPTNDIPTIQDALKVQTAINTLCDSLWLINSIIYLVAWIRGAKLLSSVQEAKQELSINAIGLAGDEPVPLLFRANAKRNIQHKSLINIHTLPHYTFREAPDHHRSYFHPQKKKKKQGKKVVSNQRKGKSKSQNKSHLPV